MSVHCPVDSELDSYICLVTNSSNWPDNCHNYVLLSNSDQYSPFKTRKHTYLILCQCNVILCTLYILSTYLAIDPTLDVDSPT